MQEKHERLLMGLEVTVQATKVRIPTLEEIFSMGVDTYLEKLQSLVMDLTEIKESLQEEGIDVNDYQTLLFLIIQEKKFRNTFFEALQLFTNRTFVLGEEGVIAFSPAAVGIDGEERYEIVQIFTEEYWIELRNILRLAHWMPKIERIEYGTGKAREMMEKFRKNQEKVRKIKEKGGESTTELYELVSAVSVYSLSYNLLNIWGLTYYQFLDQYHRLNLVDNYNFSIGSLLAGSDPKKVKIKHWTSSIDSKQ